MSRLPEYVSALLTAGEYVISQECKPSWLMSRFEDNIWKIESGGQSRSLDWRFLLGQRCFCDSEYATALRHAKLLVIAHCECPVASCHRPSQLYIFHSQIMTIVEFLNELHRKDLIAYGFASVTYGRLEKFLIYHKAHGVTGTGLFRERWDDFIRSKFAEKSERLSVDLWKACQDQEELSQYFDYDRQIRSADPDVTNVEPTIEKDVLLFARCWLKINGYYDSRGCIDIKRFSLSIGIDARRTSRRPHIFVYLRQYEICIDYRFQEYSENAFRERLSHKVKSMDECYRDGSSGHTVANMYHLVNCVCRYSRYISELSESVGAKINLSDRIPAYLKGDDARRTRSIPLYTALFIYDKMIHWAIHYSIPLFAYYSDLSSLVYAKRKNIFRSPKRGEKTPAECNDGSVDDAWLVAFRECKMPRALKKLNIGSFHSLRTAANLSAALENGGSVVPAMLRRSMTVVDAMEINSAVLPLLVCAMSLRRVDEVLSLTKGALAFNRSDGRPELKSRLAKVQIDDVHAVIGRPIPQFLYKCLEAQQEFTDSMSKLTPPRHGVGKFFISPYSYGTRATTTTRLYRATDLMCDWFEVPCDDSGRRWYVRPHEFRRFGAMSFFRMAGQDSSLPALSWWMGHKDITQTWRYVQEDLAGEEVSKLEALFAIEAISIPKPITGDAERLQKVVLEHFGVNSINMIDDDTLVAFLEDLHDQGLYSAVPHSVRTADGVRHTIFVSYLQHSDA